MGMFTSNCPKCNVEIGWFLNAPENYICKKCNNPVSKAEIWDSWAENYSKHLSSHSLTAKADDSKSSDEGSTPSGNTK